MQGLHVNGNRETRLPQTSNVRFDGLRASDVMSRARDLAFSSSSACASAGGKPSHVLKAMGLESVLLITDALDENLLLASRNLTNVLVVEPKNADPVSLVHYAKVLITKPALAKVQEMLA